MNERLNALVEFLNGALPDKMQTFFERNVVGDAMTTIYEHDDVTVDICSMWGYIEVFGLNDEEMDALRDAGFHEDTPCLTDVDWDFIDNFIAKFNE